MFWLKEVNNNITRLLSEQTSASLTYAALECRLAIERVCYERLRVAHDYISVADLRKWQPHYVVKTLLQEVDDNIASSLTLYTSTVDDAKTEVTEGDFKDCNWLKFGNQVGFDARKLGILWNALGNFLHVKIPATKKDDINIYSDANVIRSKVEEVLKELKDLENCSLITSGFGVTVTFECNCGYSNRRRANLLKNGQIIHCINPECKDTWEVIFEGDDINFQRRSIPVDCCSCSKPINLPESLLLSLERGQTLKFNCHECGTDNYIAWKLMHSKARNEPG